MLEECVKDWLKFKVDQFEAWKNGRTGFPVIDAAMIQLATTGYLNNRARTFVADFLVKLLLIDWRKGEKYFATILVDYDPLGKLIVFHSQTDTHLINSK